MYYLFDYIVSSEGNFKLAESMLRLFPPFLETTFSVVLVISALYLAKSVKEYTQKKQNTCLVSWHICNLILLIIILTLSAMFQSESSKSTDVFNKYGYYYVLTELGYRCLDLYVDLFLLWLLYRFMKPQPILSD